MYRGGRRALPRTLDWSCKPTFFPQAFLEAPQPVGVAYPLDGVGGKLSAGAGLKAAFVEEPRHLGVGVLFQQVIGLSDDMWRGHASLPGCQGRGLLRAGGSGARAGRPRPGDPTVRPLDRPATPGAAARDARRGRGRPARSPRQEREQEGVSVSDYGSLVVYAKDGAVTRLAIPALD